MNPDFCNHLVCGPCGYRVATIVELLSHNDATHRRYARFQGDRVVEPRSFLAKQWSIECCGVTWKSAPALGGHRHGRLHWLAQHRAVQE